MASNSRGTAIPVVRGAMVGLAAWLAGYLVTYLLHASDIRGSMASDVLEFLSNDAGTWKLVGWLYHNAHFVDTTYPGLVGRSSGNALTGAEDPALTALFVVPVLALVLAGAFVARGAATNPESGAKAGATVVVGYALATVVSAFVLRVSIGDSPAGPALVTAVLLAGVVYPLVLGGVGGAVAGRFGE